MENDEMNQERDVLAGLHRLPKLSASAAAHWSDLWERGKEETKRKRADTERAERERQARAHARETAENRYRERIAGALERIAVGTPTASDRRIAWSDLDAEFARQARATKPLPPLTSEEQDVVARLRTRVDRIERGES